MLLDRFGLFLVELGQVVTGAPLGMKQLVQLGVDGLRVSMLGALDDQRHEPRGEHRNAVPTKGIAVEPPPQQAIKRDYGES
jgi:hypothetical protein